ncbi:SsgA family sporulation/cell division regulator [Streptomyces sp. Q6]|uniref:SsgA family sporulation/cell division regulator n=1 Tax=Streptomyces citrinus TaxID=3118173 RepID=A0ACD5A4K3_9ACTN
MKKCRLSLHITHWVFADVALTRTCELSYDGTDPLAITMTFDTCRERPVRWILSRELLAEGLVDPVGEGDVRIWPVHDRDGGLTSFRVRLGNTRTALMEFDAEPVVNWLARTYRMVPRGTELNGVDWDELVQPVD